MYIDFTGEIIQLELYPKGVKPMTFRKNMHDGIKVSEIEERRYCLNKQSGKKVVSLNKLPRNFY